MNGDGDRLDCPTVDGPCRLCCENPVDAWLELAAAKGFRKVLALLVFGTGAKGLFEFEAVGGVEASEGAPKAGLGFFGGNDAAAALNGFAAKGDGLASIDGGNEPNGDGDGAPVRLGAPNWLPPKVAMGADYGH